MNDAWLNILVQVPLTAAVIYLVTWGKKQVDAVSEQREERIIKRDDEIIKRLEGLTALTIRALRQNSEVSGRILQALGSACEEAGERNPEHE